jgi:hypothetical protein
VVYATTDDGDAIGEVHAAAWRLGFGHVLHREFLERASDGRRNGWRYAIAHVLAVSNLVLVGGRSTHILAFSQSGRPDDGGTDLEIFQFYCHPVAWRTALAETLMHETCAVLWFTDNQVRFGCGAGVEGGGQARASSDGGTTFEGVKASDSAWCRRLQVRSRV